MNKWALITGASTGIGCELAKVFAANGWHLVLVARNEVRLECVAAELRAAHRIDVKVLAKDLTMALGPADIFEALRSTPISALVNNAGFGWQGPFARCEPKVSL